MSKPVMHLPLTLNLDAALCKGRTITYRALVSDAVFIDGQPDGYCARTLAKWLSIDVVKMMTLSIVLLTTEVSLDHSPFDPSRYIPRLLWAPDQAQRQQSHCHADS